jgi:excinuclease ABC subunit A
MAHDQIVVVGARENNLKNVTVEIPRDRLVVITGLSGSGKSSLAFDTVYAEGQRRYVESLSSYARQFLGQMDKPDVDHIDGLSPAISIDQKSASKNPRSTVGTVTEIYDYLRILFARAGIPYCPNGHGPIARQSTDTIVDEATSLPEGARLQVLAPIVRGRKGTYQKEIREAQQAGFVRIRVDGHMHEVTDEIPMDRYKQHTIEVVVDRVVVKPGVERRLAESVETALKMGKGLVTLSWESAEGGPGERTFSEHYACPECGFSMPELEPRMFSFNSPYGACTECTGLGAKTEFDPALILPDPQLPLRDGAIAPFVYKSGEAKEWWPDVLDAVGRAVGFDASLPVAELSEEHMRPVWEGLDEPVTVTMRYGTTERTFRTQWHGVLAVLRRKYEQTESDWVKNDLAQYMSTRPCPACGGRRLKPETLSVKLPCPGSDDRVSIADVASLSVEQAHRFFHDLPNAFTDRQRKIGERAVKEIQERLRFLVDVGLGYLSLDRNANTLAGGEAQRIRLATQIGSGLMGCLYVLDEPSIGLHQRDNAKLIETLKRLRDLGNTVVVVEHDEDTMRAADWLIDLGPGAGEHGGEIVNEGPLSEFLAKDSPTSRYLNGKERIEVPRERRKPRSPCPLGGPPVWQTAESDSRAQPQDHGVLAASPGRRRPGRRR